MFVLILKVWVRIGKISYYPYHLVRIRLTVSTYFPEHI